MDGIIKDSHFNNKIIDFLIKNDDYFINILDKFNNDYNNIPDSIHFHPFYENNKIVSLLIYTDEGQFYPYVSEKYLYNVSNILNNKLSSIFSIYLYKDYANDLMKLLNYQTKYYYNYYVMKLLKNDFVYNVDYKYEYPFKKCSHFDYKYLKKLQYEYHKEEVYINNIYYPYIAEMKSYKNTLKKRLNYAIFLDNKFNKALSKANVNGESPISYQLGGIYTIKDYRKKGLSCYCLVKLIEDIFKNTNKSKILLYVKKENIPAINLYIKLGFKKAFETVLYYF